MVKLSSRFDAEFCELNVLNVKYVTEGKLAIVIRFVLANGKTSWGCSITVPGSELAPSAGVRLLESSKAPLVTQ